MKTIFSICFALAFASTTMAADKSVDEKTAQDQQALQGEWIPIKAELAGKPFPDAVLKTISLKLTKNDYDVLVAGHPDKGTWSIDATAKPKGMKVVGVKGPNAGKTFPAIYELNGDTLRICYDLSGAKRPAEFKTKPDTKLYLVTYKRKKKDAAAPQSPPSSAN
jgi:uncharacterized protein (TIGR03067 family)